MKGKLVIIGAGEFQKPLVMKANEMGLETHVFAWAEGAAAAPLATKFYEVSITDIDRIEAICREIKPDGILTCGSDLAVVTVNEIAERLGLPGNPTESIKISTNKYEMRKAMKDAGVPVPFFTAVTEDEIDDFSWPGSYPFIIKPTDRSGSRGVCRIDGPDDEKIKAALREACGHAFEKRAICESFIDGDEFSCESISWEGRHTPLTLTRKFTTGDPHYIETGHIQPAGLDKALRDKAFELAVKCLDALKIRMGASHFEFRIDSEGEVWPIELGARGGGDFISTHLVWLSTRRDFLAMMVEAALGRAPNTEPKAEPACAAVKFILSPEDAKLYRRIVKDYEKWLVEAELREAQLDEAVTDSSTRHGHIILNGPENILRPLFDEINP